MVHAAHAFDARVRVLECRNCGAPATTLLIEDQFRCTYCAAVNVYEVLAGGSKAPSESSRSSESVELRQAEALAVDERAMRAIEARLVSPEHIAWVRAEAARAATRAVYDVSLDPPPDLVAMGGGTDWTTWVGTWLPALRKHWQELLPAAGAAITAPVLQRRLYWLAMRLSQAYGFKARQEPTTAESSHLHRRAVLETALQHLATTPFGAVLWCELSRAASHARDPASARAFLSRCPETPAEVEIDGEMRIALATAYVAEDRPNAQAILRLLEAAPDGELPLLTERLSLHAMAYRIHAHEVLGNAAMSRRLTRSASRRHGFRRLYGCLSMEGIAPLATRSLVMRILVAMGGAVVVLAILAWLVVTRV